MGMKGIMPILSGIPIQSRIGIVFSSSVAVFSSVQYISAKTRNKIEDSRYELEKVYGPLFTILSDFVNIFMIVGDPTMSTGKGDELNIIFSKYPHLISNKLFTHWFDEIRTQNPYEAGEYYIDPDFVADFQIEYEEKVNNYRKLVGKE